MKRTGRSIGRKSVRARRWPGNGTGFAFEFQLKAGPRSVTAGIVTAEFTILASCAHPAWLSAQSMLTKIHMLRFTKMNGAGNDFVMLDNRAGELCAHPRTNRALLRSPSRRRARTACSCSSSRRTAPIFACAITTPMAARPRCAATARVVLPDSRIGRRDRCETVSFETPAGVIGAKLSGDLVDPANERAQGSCDWVSRSRSGKNLTRPIMSTAACRMSSVPVDEHRRDRRAFVRLGAPSSSDVCAARREREFQSSSAGPHGSRFAPTSAGSRTRPSPAAPASWRAR